MKVKEKVMEKKAKYVDNSCGEQIPIEYNTRNAGDILVYELWFPLEGLFKLAEDLGQDNEEFFGFLQAGETLLREAKREIEEIYDLIEKHVGTIEVDFRDYHSGIDKKDKLGITFKPVEQTKEA
jgi:hypothetical protein